MLRHTIALACLALTVGAAPSRADDPYLPVVEVTAGDDAGLVYLGDIGAPGLWTWDGSIGSDTQPSYGGGYGAPEICSLLNIQGRPTDCNRDLLANPTADAPVLPKPSTWAGLGISNAANETNLFDCYTNQSKDPANDCEFKFKEAMAFMCMQMFTNVYDGVGSPYASCEQGRGELDLEITYARGYRSMASWFGVQLSGEVGVIEVNVNIPQLSIFNWSVFNRFLVYARKLDSCSRWYNLWDRHNCDSYFISSWS